VRVRVGDDLSAETRITVQEHAPRQGIEISIELDPNGNDQRRGRIEQLQETLKVWIHAEHPSLKGALGRYDESEGKYAGEDSPLARAVMAEVVAQVLAGYLVEREAILRPAVQWDPARVLAKNAQRVSRLVAVGQRVLEDPS
jgi:hypothetical protein